MFRVIHILVLLVIIIIQNCFVNVAATDSSNEYEDEEIEPLLLLPINELNVIGGPKFTCVCPDEYTCFRLKCRRKRRTTGKPH